PPNRPGHVRRLPGMRKQHRARPSRSRSLDPRLHRLQSQTATELRLVPDAHPGRKNLHPRELASNLGQIQRRHIHKLESEELQFPANERSFQMKHLASTLEVELVAAAGFGG